MSTIDTTGIDETKPTEGQATTQSVRDNTSAVKTQLGNAKTDIESAESRLTTNEADIDTLEAGIANLSGVTDATTARTNLSVYSTTETDALVDDLSGVTDAPTARTNLSVYSTTETDALVDDLSGVTDAATARTNLGVYSTTETDALVDDLSGVTDAATARSNLNVYSKAQTAALHGRRNAIINGDGRINQRVYVSGTATTSANEYTLDRWRVVTSGQSLTFTGTNKKTMTAPAGGVEQEIEGESLSTGTYIISWTGTATCTVDGVAKSSGDTFSLTEGTNCTVKFSSGTFTDVQLEPGSVATPFELRSIGEELALCQRYYWRGNAAGDGFGYKYGSAGMTLADVNNITFPVPMRAAPTVARITTPTYTNCSFTDLQVGSAPAVGFVERVTVTAAGSFRATSGLYEADAEI